MADSLSPGDVVQLKSGGPEMTVAWKGIIQLQDHGVEGAECIWFDGESKKQSQMFPVSTLKKI